MFLIREYLALNQELQNLEDSLGKHRQLLSELESQSDSLRAKRQTLQEIYSFGGMLEQELSKFSAVDRGEKLSQQVAKLEGHLDALRKGLDQSAINERIQQTVNKVSEGIRHYAEILGIEHFERPVRVDIKNLTLTVEGPEKRQDYLWEIGSAANWMGYHIATMLALHEHFLTVHHNVIPQFLFIDQPSQAFFPERMQARRKRKEQSDKVELDSDDIVRVKRIFRALSEAVSRTNLALQIVLIDHVGESAWEGVKDVRLVERWRGSDALIPPEWRV